MGCIERMASGRREWRVLVDALCEVEEISPVNLVEDPS